MDANAGEGGEPDDGSGGTATGGRSTGGAAPTGGVSTGGAATGGRNTGGAPTGGAATGGAATGGAATGGAATGGAATGGAAAGGAATGGKPGELSCTKLSEQLEAELDSIQSCESDDECGQPLQGTSCGCTRDLVARKDADIGRFEELLREHGDRCDGFGASTCDCPAADGYKCSSNRCGWNYQNQGSCAETPPGQLCLKRDEGALGATLEVGEKLTIQVQPKGCFSSSCTETRISTCSIEAEGHDFVAKAQFCMADTSVQGGGCTADCSGGFAAECQTEMALTKGEHTVTLGDMSLTFTVPGTIPEDALCSGDRF